MPLKRASTLFQRSTHRKPASLAPIICAARYETGDSVQIGTKADLS